MVGQVIDSTAVHFVYRMFDSSGRLLYVGMTGNLEQRLHHHSFNAPWYGRVARTTVETYPDRAAAIAAEKHAIQTEQPELNTTHNATVRANDRLDARQAAQVERTLRERPVGGVLR